MPTLQWLTREQDMLAAQGVPYRLLEEVPKLSAGDRDAENLLIQGDNLEALKSLLPFFAGQVKCIYIDPPYNTKSAFEHYDDNLEHSTWLGMMYPRLQLLRELLAEDGSIWVSIDDHEGHYLKVLMDDVFGRGNFVGNVVWQSKDTPGNNSSGIAQTHNHIIAFRKSNEFKPNLLERNEKQLATYTNPDNDQRGPWLATPLTRVEHRERDVYAISNKVGRMILPPKGSSWRRPPAKMKELEIEDRIWWGRNGDAEFPMEKKFLAEVKEGVVNQTWWKYEFGGSTRNASAEMKALFGGTKTFETPKPERLLYRIFSLASDPGDLVLDSFLGSGTTAAVAHKMGRRYIGIELGDHAQTHCVPRLNKVIEGEQGGISKDVGWEGGGGFRFCELGPTVFDEEGQIREGIRFNQLAGYVWFTETFQPWRSNGKTPFLGVYADQGFALLYNGILGDKRPDGGNVLTRATLADIREAAHKKTKGFDGPMTVYGEQSRLSSATLMRERITFKQTPYDVKARA